MTKDIEEKKLEAKKKQWDGAVAEFDVFWNGVKREVRISTRKMLNFLMYYKKPSKKGERFAHTAEWWAFMIGVFFAFKGITYTVFGR